MFSIQEIRNFLLSTTTKNVVVIEIVESGEGNIFVNTLLLNKVKTSIYIKEKQINIPLPELQKWSRGIISKKTPVLLLINGSKVIHKRMPHNGIQELAEQIKSHIHNANIEDFYGHTLPIDEKTDIISIARKKYIDDIIDQVCTFLPTTISVSMGPFSIVFIYKFLTDPDKDNVYHVSFGNYNFRFSTVTLIDYKIHQYTLQNNKSSKKFNIDGEVIPEELLIPYSHGLNYLVSPWNIYTIENSDIETVRSEFFFSRLSALVITFNIVIIFISLIVSSVIFTIYTNENVKLSALYQDYIRSIELRQNNEKRNTEQLAILEQYGLSSISKSTQYLDDVISTLPDNMYLRKIAIFPVLSNSEEVNVMFNASIIQADGSCYSSIDLNFWITELKKHKWVKDIIINDYTRNENDDINTFSIVIKK